MLQFRAYNLAQLKYSTQERKPIEKNSFSSLKAFYPIRQFLHCETGRKELKLIKKAEKDYFLRLQSLDFLIKEFKNNAQYDPVQKLTKLYTLGVFGTVRRVERKIKTAYA